MAEHSRSSSPSAASAAVSLPRRVVHWLANRSMWTIMGAGIVLGLAANRTAQFDSIAWVFFLAGGLLPIVLQTVTTEDDGYQYDISNRERVGFVASMLAWSLTPWGILSQVLQIGGNCLPYLRYRGRVPNRERHVPETDLSLPFDKEWTTVNGGVTKDTSHSWGLVSQRYAYDFVMTDAEGETHEGDGSALEDYYAFGEPLRAPAGGTVVKTLDRLRDFPAPGGTRTEWRTWHITGNYVVIDHGDGEYSMLAHLQQDSVTVEPGDHVERGEVVGRCGNSGLSTEPHLHYQLMDRSNFWSAAGLVPQFRNVAIERDDDRRDGHAVYESREDENRDEVYLWAGDRVSDNG